MLGNWKKKTTIEYECDNYTNCDWCLELDCSFVIKFVLYALYEENIYFSLLHDKKNYFTVSNFWLLDRGKKDVIYL